MIEIAVKCRGLDDLHLTYQKPVLFEEIVKAVQPQAPYRIYGVRFCHQLRHMKETADQSGVLEVLDLRDPEGNMIYQSSLTFLYLKAIHDLFGSDADAIVKNSLSKGLFTTIRAKQLGRDTADRIEIRMQELADMALPITRIPETRENLLKKSDFRKDQKKLLETAPDLKELYLYRLGEQEELFYEPLVPDTSYLTLFEVRRYMNGFLLRFPHPSDPDDIPPFEEQKLLYEAFSEETHWNRLTGIEYASDLNTAVKEGKAQDLILLNEALHEKRIAEIASRIKEQGSRLILIAGPSSSGKTSFAKRLQIQLRVLGLKPLYLGTDDYYEERKNIPLKKDGT